ncbi:hypothetical protein JHK82_026936 [Glycine max]|nr:hypothetical protein JHK82_026936 [Glycine max]
MPLTERLGSGTLFSFDHLPTLDKAAQQRQRRMIKNRESAARSRERKQAYQVELESLAVKLEEENDKLLKEKETISFALCRTSKLKPFRC